MTIPPEINVDIKKSLPSCMKTATVTKGRMSGTDKGRAAIIEGKRKAVIKRTEYQSKKRKQDTSLNRGEKQGGFYEPYKV